MRRLLIALAIFTLLIWGSLWSFRTVKATASAIADEVEAGHLEAAYILWQAAESKFGALLMHDEIDEANRLFARVLAAQASDGDEEISLDCAELLAQLRHLPELEKPTLKNLL